MLALAVPLGHWLAAVAQGRLPRLQGFDVGVLRACGATADLLILDLGLPDGDGVDLIHDLRGWSTLPVVVLSLRTDEADKIERWMRAPTTTSSSPSRSASCSRARAPDCGAAKARAHSRQAWSPSANARST